MGEGAYDRLGGSLSRAGDVNGDGFGDFILGAAGNGEGGYNAGAAYVIFGKAGGIGAIDLADLDPGDGFKILGDAPYDRAGLAVAAAGDVDGDGFGDLLVAAPSNDSGGANAGAAYLIFGRQAGIGDIDLESLDPGDGVRIRGAAAYDYAGYSLSAAGDVNGDGFDDIAIGAYGRNGQAGALYLVFGDETGIGPVDLADLGPADGFEIAGGVVGARAGIAVAAAGDVNGDGFADIVIGADGHDGGGADAGMVYVILGRETGFASVDLAALAPADGFAIQGAAAGDRLGLRIAGAGDVNADGYDDILLGAFGDANGTDAGAAYLIFGRQAGFGPIDLAALDPADGVRIDGANAGDAAGIGVAGAGDVNGDGYDDLLIGAFLADGGGTDSGAAYIVFGRASGLAAIDLADLGAADGFRLDGESGYDHAGASVAGAGDIDGDGYDDLLVGAPDDGTNGSNAGAAYIVYGAASPGDGTPPTLDLNGAGAGADFAADYTEGGTGAAIGADIVITARGGPIQTATITIADAIAGDMLLVAGPLPGGITSAGSGGALVLSGPASARDWEAALARIRFSHAGDDPTRSGSDTSRTLVILLDDGSRTSVPAHATIGIEAVNDAPVAVDDELVAQEDVAANYAAADLAGNDLDDDGPDVLAVVAVSNAVNGNVALGPDGIVTFSPSPGYWGPASFDYQVSDGLATDSGTAFIAVQPVNDPAVIGGDTRLFVVEDDVPSATGRLTIADSDAGEGAFQPIPAGGGSYGTFVLLADGQWSYTLDNGLEAVQALGAGATLADTIVAVSVDGTTQLLEAVVKGTNDMAAIGGTIAGDVAEDGIATASGTLTVTDPDAGEAGTAPNSGVATGYGSFGNDSEGVWTYTLDPLHPAVQALGAGATLTDSFAIDSLDGSAHQTIALTIHGSNDVPVIGGDTTGAATEDDPAVTSGALTIGDMDEGESRFVPIVAGRGRGGFGVFDVDAGGHWTYALDSGAAAVQALGAGETATDAIDVASYDGSASQSLIIIVHGTNDAPALADAIPDHQGAEDVAVSHEVPATSFIDIDSDGLTFEAALGDGSALPAWLLFDPASRTFSGTPPQDFNGVIAIRVTVSDGSASVAGLFDLVIALVDDAPVARPDAVATDEASVLGGSVFGNDSDVDGPGLSVAEVNGAAANVGTQILLASGALLILNADGAFVYDPNHAFDATPAAGSGASNMPATDSFAYTLAGGGTATVTVTVHGLDSDDLLLGSPGDDILSGGAGDDRMAGGAGNDLYIFDRIGDAAIEAGGEGIDIIYSAVSYALGDTSEVESLSTITWQLLDPLNLTGNGLANHLIGNAGPNLLDGGAGNDVLIGREGDDIYVVDGVGDWIIEAAGGGADTIRSPISYRLNDGAEIEGLSTIDTDATDAIDLSGNALDNGLIGNAGANQLDGGGGADLMEGRGGNDIYLFDHAADQALEGAGAGYDVIYSAVGVALGDASEVEGLSTIRWDATDAVDLTGNRLDNDMIGNAGQNRLDGKGGNDVLQGREGADIFAFTTALGADNIDHLFDFEAGVDTIALDGAMFAGLLSGALAPGAFVIGSAAGDADDRIVYDGALGRLYFDADGDGAGAAIHFANIAPGLGLDASDFTVI